MTNNKHEFALYIESLPHVKPNKELVCTDKELVHRVHTILRMAPGQTLILFDKNENLTITLTSLTKKELVAHLVERKDSQVLKPAIRFLLPLLKREALEEAIYSLVELGAQEIQLIITQKSLHSLPGKGLERLTKIAVAAAEQSKNFSFPTILPPISLAESSKNGPLICFDPEGDSALEVVESLRKKNAPSISLIIGPEGGLTPDEIMLLKNAKASFCRLTPTILRARSAVTVGLGMLRSLINFSS
jgi:16S rRNA (uracil1498-N3)-methyltransferase